MQYQGSVSVAGNNSDAEIAAIAKEAYIYAYALIVHYCFFHAQSVDEASPIYVGFNKFFIFRQQGSPDYFNKVPWVNTDTAYTVITLDLRTEPYVLRVPPLEKHRYYMVQFYDFYTHTPYIRSTANFGNGGKTFLFAGPEWSGEVPPGIDEVIRSETQFGGLFLRILLESGDTYEDVFKLYETWGFQPLSEFLGVDPPKPAPPIEFPLPTWNPKVDPFFEAKSTEFIPYLNFMMGFCPIHPSERDLFERFARIGIAPGRDFKESQRYVDAMDPSVRATINAAIDEVYPQIDQRVASMGTYRNGWMLPLENKRGFRERLAGSHQALLNRAALARWATWLPDGASVTYVVGNFDDHGAQLDGSLHNYRIHFPEAPPCKGFWSLTVYDAYGRVLVPHASGRYALRDRSPGPIYNPDGSLTLYLQHDAPVESVLRNWLPVPKIPFKVVLRLHCPPQAVIDARYQYPPIQMSKGKVKPDSL